MSDESRRFTRRPEDFVCAHCGCSVRGTGYTNHCPRCLWSRHVDVLPGDRLADCGGLMEPVGVLYEGGENSVVHRCVECGRMWRNRTAASDDRAVIIGLSGKPVGWPPPQRRPLRGRCHDC
ncbi:MAG: RNHCP domain-containing protein [Pseudonocardiaceae bacterium]